MSEKLKSWLADDTLFISLLVVLVAVTSFGLGRQSVVEVGQRGSVVQTADAAPVPTSGTQVVGSRSGTKYHLPDCPGAEQMKEENKVYFDSIQLAEAAGYTAAGNCPGLQ
jgi:hypothetical protein